MRFAPTRATHALVCSITLALVAACGERAAITAPTAERPSAALDGAADVPTLVVTEVMPDPTKVLDTAGEWIEIYNPGDAPVDLRGWQLASGPTVVTATTPPSERHTIAVSVVVPARGLVVLGTNADPALNGGVSEAYAYGGAITLNNSTTDWLTLKRPDGTLADSVAYSPSTVTGTTRVVGTPTYTPRAGFSRLAVDLGAGHAILSDPAAWRNATDAESYGAGDRGTPGSGTYGPAVPAGPPVTVVVSPASATVGATVQLRAAALDSAQRAATTTFRWSSVDTTIATVDSLTGLATAVGGGSVVVRAVAANGVEGMGTLAVSIPGGVARMTFSGRNLSDPPLPVGFEDQLFATAFDAAGQRVTTALTWGTTTPDLVQVDANGVVRATAAGRATVTARSADGFTGSWTVLTTLAEPSTTARYAENADFGEPTDADASDDFLVRRTQYTLSYNRARGGPNWVSYNLEASHFGTLDRCDCFSPDPALPADYPRIQTSDYTGGGYDRGHLVRSFDRTAGALDNATTFYTTNILPQTADNNQGPWAAAEDSLGRLARLANREVHVITGGAGSLGTVRNEGRIVIPALMWKVAIVLPRDRGLADVRTAADVDDVIAIVMPNVPGIRNVPWTTYEVSVDSVERLTGYDLLARLPDNLERQLETGDRPPVASAGGNDAARTSYVGSEGQPVTFAGSATDPDVGDVLTFAWDFGDGTRGTGAAPQHAYTDDGSYTATLTVTDSHGVTDAASVPVRIANVSPVVATFPGATILRGERYVAAGTFADPGADAWTATVEWGSGGPEPLALDGRGFALDHAYADAGSYTVTVTVRDDDAGTGTGRATVLVRTPREGVAALAADVRALRAGTADTPPLGAGNVNALGATLDAAARQLDGGQGGAAVNTLGGFVNQVGSLRDEGLLSRAAAERLAGYAQRIARSITG
ncbi:MAG TPA: DNA/RNA non-specific endonuclease [Gemmatirosa sp.]|nr:DNA/RNA non-specific endonuclease [Gemmatirosa sp.]